MTITVWLCSNPVFYHFKAKFKGAETTVSKRKFAGFNLQLSTFNSSEYPGSQGVHNDIHVLKSSTSFCLCYVPFFPAAIHMLPIPWRPCVSIGRRFSLKWRWEKFVFSSEHRVLLRRHAAQPSAGMCREKRSVVRLWLEIEANEKILCDKKKTASNSVVVSTCSSLTRLGVHIQHVGNSAWACTSHGCETLLLDRDSTLTQLGLHKQHARLTVL